MAPSQREQAEWHYQWSRLQDDAPFLFEEWIHPNSLESFRGLRILEAGCGGGHHTRLVASHCASVTAVDLNTAELADGVIQEFGNVTVVKGDIATIAFDDPFDVVFSVGVVHHTDDPDETVENLKRLVSPGGRLILWVYSREGNAPARLLVELPRRLLLRFLPRPLLEALAWVLTLCIYPAVHSLYRLPIRSLPYYEYMQNWRRLTARRNMLNVFDKLNAPQTQFMSESRVRGWGADPDFTLEHLSRYVGVSWRVTLTRRGAPRPEHRSNP